MKSRFSGPLSLESFSPYPKNPLLASFFVNIGRADTLGSGMKNIYKYTKLYSKSEPVLSEGDIFEIKIPLKKNTIDNSVNEKRDANMELNEANEANLNEANEANQSNENLKLYEEVLSKIIDDSKVTQVQLANALNVSRSTIQRVTKTLAEQGRIERRGGTRGCWKVNNQMGASCEPTEPAGETGR